jgi:nickel transport protein
MRRFSLALLGLVLLAAPARAHKLKLFATVEGADIVGEAYFAGGDKAMTVPGRLLGADGTLVAGFTTGEDGSFRLTVPRREDYAIRVESGDGHAADFTIHAAEFPPSLPPGKAAAPVDAVPQGSPAAPGDTTALEAAMARQIRPLREQLDSYEDRLRLHDLLGGIGTIFGLFGCYAWLQSRRREP